MGRRARLGRVLGCAALACGAAGLGCGGASRLAIRPTARDVPLAAAADIEADAWATIAPASTPDDVLISSVRPAIAGSSPSPWLVLDPSFKLGDPPYRVARVTAASVPVFDRPDAAQPRLELPARTSFGGPRVFLVVGTAVDRVEVLLPLRPNDSVAWVPASAVTVEQVSTWVSVDLGAHRLIASDARGRFLDEPAATGTGGTPTPRGIYYVTDSLRPVGQPAYGPYAFALSAHSDVLFSFAGGDGTVGIHGTDAPGALGQAVSHGCVRVSNAAVTKLAEALPVGTPVFIA